jgi:hypothetical protein
LRKDFEHYFRSFRTVVILCPLVGAHPSGCYNGVLMGPGVGALRQPPRLQSGDTFGIFTMRTTFGSKLHGSCTLFSVLYSTPSASCKPHGLTIVSKCDPRDLWTNKRNCYLVKISHAEYAEFAEAHTRCLCLPSGWWRKWSVRLCVFLTYNSIPIPHGFRDFRAFCVK